MHPEFQARLVPHAMPQHIQHGRHVLQVLRGCAPGTPRTGIDLQMIAAQAFDEPRQAHMFLENLLVLRRILEMHFHVAAVGDGVEFDADGIGFL